jgi:Tol biopolymer transport system component
MDADGSRKRALTEGDSPDWGPDGRIAFARGGLTSARAEIFVIDSTGANLRQLTNGGDSESRIHPSWSPDGQRIEFVQLVAQDPAQDDTSNGCPALPVRPELWIVDADGGNARRLTSPTGSRNVDASGRDINSAFDANSGDWSPAGDVIAFWSGQEACFGQVWRIDADGTGRTQLTHAPLPSHNDDPAWSPDGTKILFSTDRRGVPEMWMMDADGSNEHFVATNRPGPGPADAAWQPVRLPR